MENHLFPQKAIEILRRARYDPNATFSFEIMSGGLRWSDERMEEVTSICMEQGSWAFRLLWGFRASLIRGAAREELRPPWDQLQKECPEWPGFRSERCSANLRGKLDSESRRASMDLERLDRACKLQTQLGGVGLSRIVRDPTPGKATEEHLLRLAEQTDKRLCELIDGTLVEKVSTIGESMFGASIGRILDAYVRPINFGLVAGPNCPLRVSVNRIRMPDVAVFSWERMPGRAFPAQRIIPLAPNLCIEILNEANTDEEMRLKRIDYFKSAVELVWEIDPATRVVRVYTDVNAVQELSGNDQLDGGNVLPGFTPPLGQLFGELDRHG